MTQERWILNALIQRKTRGLTAIDALRGCGCFRLAARISELRKAGHRITTEAVIANGKVFARYRIVLKKRSKK
jgi:hypothetical protein